MPRPTEWNINDDRIYAAIKYPDGLNKKWSEAVCHYTCANCEATDTVVSDTDGLWGMIACTSCSNWWHGECRDTVYIYDTEEIKITLPAGFETTDTTR